MKRSQEMAVSVSTLDVKHITKSRISNVKDKHYLLNQLAFVRVTINLVLISRVIYCVQHLASLNASRSYFTACFVLE